MLGPAYPVVNGPENLVFTAGKRGRGGGCQGENPLIQRHAHNALTGAWRDEIHWSEGLAPRVITIGGRRILGK